MKAFVTGGTGFIGSHLVRKLIERGWKVNALVRSQSGAAKLSEMGAVPIWGDITASESMREGMRGCDAVFHVAGWYKLGSASWRQAEMINVEGTRNVLTLAHQLGVPRIIYTSTVAVYGDTHGFTPDETYSPHPCTFLTEYDRTKHIAHYHVVEPMIQQGVPVTIVMPGGVYGPGDPSLIGQLMKMYYMGLMMVAPGPGLTMTYAHVEDIAEGHILAYEQGKPGEIYHLTGQALTTRRAMRMWAQITGRKPPSAWIPGRWLVRLIPVVDFISHYVTLPEAISRDAISILEASYLGRSEKAITQLGWTNRPLSEGFAETFEWIAEQSRPLTLSGLSFNRRKAAGVALGAALGVLVAYLILRRRQ